MKARGGRLGEREGRLASQGGPASAGACCARLPFWSRAAATAAGFGRKERSQSGGREAVTWAQWAG